MKKLIEKIKDFFNTIIAGIFIVLIGFFLIVVAPIISFFQKEDNKNKKDKYIEIEVDNDEQ